MVRINLINPKYLADQHLIAEYLEIIMLISFIKKFQNKKSKIPDEYCLGKGHMLFFKDKILYLKNRHETIKREMQKRGFKTNKTLNINNIKPHLFNNYQANKKDKERIKKRLIQKLKLKPKFYKYYGKKQNIKFLINLIKKEK